MSTTNLPASAIVLSGNFRDLQSVKAEVVGPHGRAFLPFSTLFDYGSGSEAFISAAQHNGDWEYRFVILVTDWRDATGNNDEPRWNVQLLAVSPQAAGLRETMKAVQSMGFEREFFERIKTRAGRMRVLYETLVQYGVYARFTDTYGNNLRDLMKQARHEAFKASSLFGFYMDRPQNRIGDSGWDFISGNVAGSRERAHLKYLESRGLTQEEFLEQREAKELARNAEAVSLPVSLVPYVGGKKPMELEKAHALWRAGKLEFIERFVGGLTDDRGGYWRGADERRGIEAFDADEYGSRYGSTSVGDPKDVLTKRSDRSRLICSLDEEGQFQTYWSLWRVR